MPNGTPSRKPYDVVIVGSGAGGGVAAQVLALAGAKICMLEAGEWFDCTTDSTMFQWPYNVPHRGAATREKPGGYFDATLVGGWQVPGEPYTNAAGSQWRWWRARMLGGRTNHYDRVSLRMGEPDLKAHSRDGYGTDWPISYSELSHYYDKAEELIGVFGSNEGLIGAPDGRFLPAPAPRAYERVIQLGCQDLHIPCISSRLAILTRPLHGRPACHYCGQCRRSCGTNSNFSSPGVHIFPAMRTGNLEVRTGSMAREVVVGANGLARGVSYIDKHTRRETTVYGKVVVLAASACETARILLNSKSSLFPDGLANSSGQVGRNLMDTVSVYAGGYLPVLEDLPPFNEDGTDGSFLYMPQWLYGTLEKGRLPFARGYHVEFGGGRRQPGAGVLQGSEQILGGGYGVSLKRALRKIFGCNIWLQGLGEMLPNQNSYCEIDPDAIDEWGIPALRFHFQWGEQELEQAKHQQKTLQQILETSGGKVTFGAGKAENWGILRGGETIHEVGVTRMGSDPKTSVLNPYCQAWDCKNLFVTDGGPFVSNSDKNPTLTITALGWRTSDHIIRQVNQQGI